ncbi:MAG TPA: hypothetical protein VHY81_04700, partial [Acidimicrobiales bacterium]|nr:hypothetical protein [Acidimicrobiales bacterium]
PARRRVGSRRPWRPAPLADPRRTDRSSNFPTTNGRRSSFTIDAYGGAFTLTITGAKPSGKILFELPSFVRNISSTSAGAVDQHTGTVTLAPDVHHVTVTLRRAP